MEQAFKGIAVVFVIALALVTGSLYVRGVREDISEQQKLNLRLAKLCAQARLANWSDEDRTDYLERNCQGI